jgi:hypothetical protein
MIVNALLKVFAWVERRATRILTPVISGLVLFTAWVLRRGRYSRWRREAERSSRAKKPQGGGSGWE